MQAQWVDATEAELRDLGLDVIAHHRALQRIGNEAADALWDTQVYSYDRTTEPAPPPPPPPPTATSSVASTLIDSEHSSDIHWTQHSRAEIDAERVAAAAALSGNDNDDDDDDSGPTFSQLNPPQPSNTLDENCEVRVGGMQYTWVGMPSYAWTQIYGLIDATLAEFKPSAFKFGITAGYDHRFWNNLYGYFVLGYHCMQVLCCGSPSQGQFLERHLIERYSEMDIITQNIMNNSKGGEKPPPGSTPTYVYVAVANSQWAGFGSKSTRARRLQDPRIMWTER